MIIMEGSKTLFCSSKFPGARERISSKIIDNRSTRSRKVSQAWAKGSCNGPIPVQGRTVFLKIIVSGR